MAAAAAGLSPPDWSAPWFQGWADAGLRAGAALAAGLPVHAALAPVPGGPCFVPQHALPAGTPYESHVFASGSVPSRDNLHDLLNGIAWQVYPAAKRLLNRLQAEAIARDGTGGRRGPLRDAITLFDENGAVLSAPPELHALLRERRWRTLFVERRALWRQARLWLFGHALAEQLARQPRKDLTAHVLCAPAGLDHAAAVDGWLARLDARALAAKPFAPLPVLGVPGWWPANGDAVFYADESVFRPARR